MGFCDGSHWQRLEAVIRRGIWSGLCGREHPTLEQLVEDADDTLFTYVLHNQQHVLHTVLSFLALQKFRTYLGLGVITSFSVPRTFQLLDVILSLVCCTKTPINFLTCIFLLLCVRLISFLPYLYFCYLVLWIAVRQSSNKVIINFLPREHMRGRSWES